jgi:hypothetical protein
MDLFINKLAEGTAIKGTDYTVFDVANTTTGNFSTKKISYSTITKQLNDDISANVKSLIDALQANINTTNANLANKLDKKGLTFNSSERMTGTLHIPTLCATEIAYFAKNVNVNNNYIQNVRDPLLDQDAVNKRTLTAAINALSIPGGGTFLAKSGDTMTAGNLTLSAEPTLPKHATTKFYVDKEVTKTTNLINSINTSSRNYIPLSGGVMTSGFITAPNGNPPTDDKHLSNKKYVDDQISTRTANFVTTTTLGVSYVRKAGDTMTGSLFLTGAPTSINEASNKKYVDDRIATINTNLAGYLNTTSADATYLRKAGDTMTNGDLTLFRDPTQLKHATTMQWVSSHVTTRTANFVTVNSLGTTYVAKAGDTMTGSLTLKGFSEISGATSTTGNVAIDLRQGNTFPIILTGNITGFSFSNIPSDTFSITMLITQGTAGSFTVNFSFTGFTVKWSNSIKPTITTTANKTDIFCFTRIGTVLYAFNAGQNF